MWNDNRLHRFHPVHRPPAVSSDAQKLPHRYDINQHPRTLPTNEYLQVCWGCICMHFIFPITHPFFCIPTGTTKKSAMVEEPAAGANGSAKTEQKEEIESSWEGLIPFLFCSCYCKRLGIAMIHRLSFCFNCNLLIFCVLMFWVIFMEVGILLYIKRCIKTIIWIQCLSDIWAAVIPHI